jgi:hypothetical protein
VDARDAVCAVTALSAGASILEPPVAGYSISLAAVTQLDSTGAVVNESAVALAASSTPIVLANVLLQPPSFAVAINVSVSCKRSQGDSTIPFVFSERIVDASVAWLAQPPAQSISQQSFSLSVAVVDRAAAAAPSGAGVVGADGSMLVPVALDSVSRCVLSVTTNDSLIVLQNAAGVAVAGVVNIVGASLSARSGSVVEGVLTCSLGNLAFPNALQWSILIQACARGSAPAGVGGYSCTACGSGTYSDGGAAVVACTRCPTAGVDCSGGILRLLPAFSRADLHDTIDQTTELVLGLLRPMSDCPASFRALLL